MPMPTSGKGVMSYADELFDMRMRQHEIKQLKRNMVDPQKFEFQQKHVKPAYGTLNPRESITNEKIEEAIRLHQGDELGVNWEFLDEVPRTKALRRINLILEKEQIESGTITLGDHSTTRAKVHHTHMRTSSLPPQIVS